MRPSSKIENISNFPEIRSLSIVKVGTQQETPSVFCPERVNVAGVAPRRSKRRKLFHTQKKSNSKGVQDKLDENESSESGTPTNSWTEERLDMNLDLIGSSSKENCSSHQSSVKSTVDRKIVKKEESAQNVKKKGESLVKKEDSVQKTEKLVQSSIDKDHFKIKTTGPSSSADSTFAANFQNKGNLKRGGRYDQLSTKTTALHHPTSGAKVSDCEDESRKCNPASEQIKIDYSFAEERIAMQRKISDLELAICRVSDQSIETTVTLEKQVQELMAENLCLKQALDVTLTKLRQWNQEMIRAGMQNNMY